MRLRRTLLLAALSSGVAIACNALTGVGDLHVLDDTAEANADADADATAVLPPPMCRCAPPAGDGWNGPLALVEQAGSANPTCPPGLASILAGGLEPDIPSPACEPCRCSLQEACTGFVIRPFFTRGCANACPNNPERTITSNCASVTYCAAVSAAQVIALDAGRCSPSGGSLRPARWKNTVAACGFVTVPASDRCPSGDVCTPNADVATNARTCIVRDGEHDCPPGPYSARTLVRAALTDTRSCSRCACGSANATCSAGTITFYNNTDCTQEIGTVATPAGCGDTSPNDGPGSAKVTTPSQVLDGGCPPSGGDVIDGGVTTEQPWTACCLP